MITRGVYFLAEKSEVFQKFMEFRSLVENETYKVKAKKTMFEDRRNTHHRSWCLLENGIRRQFACSYTTQQNGVAEKTTLGETA